MSRDDAIYGGDENFLWFKWPDAFDDLLSFAHPWRQCVPHETRSAAQAVIDKYPAGLVTAESFMEFMACFEKPFDESQSRYIPEGIRADVLGAGFCAVCGSTGPLHVDHKKPISRGGSNHRTNLQCLCATCNISKGARTMEEWLG